MNQSELDEIEALIKHVISASTKAEAKQPLKRLNFIQSSISSTFGGNAAYKLSEAISSAESAAGRVSDKEHHAQRAKMHLLTFKNILARSDTIK